MKSDNRARTGRAAQRITDAPVAAKVPSDGVDSVVRRLTRPCLSASQQPAPHRAQPSPQGWIYPKHLVRVRRLRLLPLPGLGQSQGHPSAGLG